MNSQSFDVDKKIRDVTDSMILQTAIGNVFTLSRPIRRSVALVEATAQADSRIADNLKFEPLHRWRLYFMPKYFKYVESFNAPERTGYLLRLLYLLFCWISCGICSQEKKRRAARETHAPPSFDIFFLICYTCFKGSKELFCCLR